MHAEYIAPSSAMRELVPIKHILDHICKTFQIARTDNTQIIKVWEDNKGAMKLAQAPIKKTTPHSKHLGLFLKVPLVLRENWGAQRLYLLGCKRFTEG